MQSELAPAPVEAVSSRSQRLHPLTLLFSTLGEGQALAVPALVGGVMAGGGHMARMLGWVLVLLVVPSAVWAAAEYLRFRYRVEGDSLIIDRGVWGREHRVIPAARVQNIDLKQNFLQRMLGVAELHVETAGGESSEAALSVLAVGEAEQLRRSLLALRAGSAEAPAEAPVVLARLSTRDLLLAGATANEAGVVAAGLIGAVELAYELRFRLPIPGGNWRSIFLERSAGELAMGGLALAGVLVLLAWGFSIIGAVVSYAGFTLRRTPGELHKSYGSLVRREAAVPLERVQVVRIEESLLRRPLGLAALKIETAATAPGQGQHRGVEAFLPLVRAEDAGRLVAEVFDGLDYGALEFRPVDPLARRHVFLRYAAAVLVLTAALVGLGGGRGFWTLALLPAAYAGAHLHYRSLGYAVSGGFVVARGGWLNRITWIVPLRRVQTLHESATLFQRRHGLASVVVDTAAGGAYIPNLRRQAARDLLDQLNRALEHSTRRTPRSVLE